MNEHSLTAFLVEIETDITQRLDDFDVSEHRAFYTSLAEWACVKIELLTWRE